MARKFKTLNGTINADDVVGDLPSREDIAFWKLDLPNNPQSIIVDLAAKSAAMTPDLVEAEYERRQGLSFTWNGHAFQVDERSQARITAQALEAQIWLTANPASGTSLRWADPGVDMAWIAADNTPVAMSADGMIAFAKAVAAHVRALRFAARALKDMSPIPADYQTDSYWT